MHNIIGSPKSLPTSKISAAYKFRSLTTRVLNIAFGLGLAAAVAGAAFTLHLLPGLTLFAPLVIALALGMIVRAIFGVWVRAEPGLKYSTQAVLRICIVLLGFQIAWQSITELNPWIIVIVIVSLVVTFATTVWLGKLFGVDNKLIYLLATGTTICGASAVVAANAVTRTSEEDVAYAIACISILGSLAMVAYPILQSAIALDPIVYGVWSGASLHEVAQVLGAGYAVGPDAGGSAIVTKLLRVVLLAPAVMLLAIHVKKDSKLSSNRVSFKNSIPLFVPAFLIVSAFNSYVAIWPSLKNFIATANGFMFTVSLAALGLQTNLGKVLAKGIRPVLVSCLAFLLLSSLTLALLKVAV